MPDSTKRIADLSDERRSALLAQLVQQRLAKPVAMPKVEPPDKVWSTSLPPDTSAGVVLGRPGNLDTIGFRRVPREAPHEGEVEVEVHAVGLNFRDVMIAVGLYPRAPGSTAEMGSECSGVIVRVGEGVDPVHIGQEVVALTTGLATHARADFNVIAPKPPAMRHVEAATIPIASMTALFGLRNLGQLAAGERVLIHSAAGGVGLAALQIAKTIGAEIIATTGTAEKREYLRSLGIEHIFDSRSLDFAKDILELTEGRGVDVVLNSLAGEAIVKGLEVLRPLGRFIEIGKRDIHRNMQIGLLPFSKALSFHALELWHLIDGRPALARSILHEVMKLCVDGVLKPLRVKTFPISDFRAAIDYMSQGTHMGKIALRVR